jgi:NADPH:quinone reductase-like Zn-dependent oxidoreductase
VAAAALKPSDRLMARGGGYAPAVLPHVVGLDGVGRLGDGTRVAFMISQPPYGGMAEQTLVRRGAWLAVPDGVDDVTAAAVANPGMAAWKTISWEGRVEEGHRVLILGATGMSGRIAAQLAIDRGARVVAAGRDKRVLDLLDEWGAAATMSLERSGDEIAASVTAEGPFDLIVDYVWGAPAEAVFAALAAGTGRRTRYLVVGMTAGDTAALPAMALRRSPVELIGSGTLPPPTPTASTAAYADLLRRAAAGDISVDVDTRPLAAVEQSWTRPSSEHRVVLIP